MILSLELRGWYEEGSYLVKDEREWRPGTLLTVQSLGCFSGPREWYNVNTLIRFHTLLLGKQEIQILPSLGLLWTTTHPPHSLQVFLNYNLILALPWVISGDPSLLHMSSFEQDSRRSKTQLLPLSPVSVPPIPGLKLLQVSCSKFCFISLSFVRIFLSFTVWQPDEPILSKGVIRGCSELEQWGASFPGVICAWNHEEMACSC